jgi:hypothetical protein
MDYDLAKELKDAGFCKEIALVELHFGQVVRLWKQMILPTSPLLKNS